MIKFRILTAVTLIQNQLAAVILADIAAVVKAG